MYTVTTFNMLHRPEMIEERVELLLVEAQFSDAVLLQEVSEQNFPLIEKLSQKEGWHVSAGEFERTKDPEKFFTNVTLTKTEPLDSYTIMPPDFPAYQQPPMLVTVTQEVSLINVHLAWGNREHLRLLAMRTVSSEADSLHKSNPDRLVVVGGDFNTVPESATIRYLRGLDPHEFYTEMWTDAWRITETFPTARKTGGWAEETANSVGIVHPELMPDRTIDYLMSYGWNYGKKGCPVSLLKFGISTLSNGYGLSDHYGITVQFLT